MASQTYKVGRVALTRADVALDDTRLRRISYNSPFEVALAISSAAGSIALLSSSLVGVWIKVQRAKRETASTMTHILAEEIIQDELEHYRMTRGEPVSHRTEAFIQAATRASLNMSNLEVEPDA